MPGGLGTISSIFGIDLMTTCDKRFCTNSSGVIVGTTLGAGIFCALSSAHRKPIDSFKRIPSSPTMARL